MIRLSGTGLFCSVEMAGIIERWAAIMRLLSFVGMNTEKHVPAHDYLSKSLLFANPENEGLPIVIERF